jgi:hypothetical protein
MIGGVSMLKKVVAVTLALFFFNSASFAALAQSSGPYVDVNVGSDIDFNLSGSADVGYKVNDFFAIEGGGATYSSSNGSNYLFDLAAKAILPFASGANIFAKFGGAYVHGHGSFEPVVYYGAGVGYSFTPNLSGVLQWNTTAENDGVGAPNLFYIGLNYNF